MEHTEPSDQENAELNMECSDGESESDLESESKNDSNVYIPGKEMEEGEQLVHDESTYIMYHQAQTGSPCLSFDVIKDGLGEARQTFPMEMYIVAATQSEQGRANHVIVMKMSNLHSTRKDKDEENSDDEDDIDSDEKPEMETAMVMHTGGVNRVRCTDVAGTHLAATWSDRRSVHIWDLKRQIAAVENPTALSEFVANRQNRVAPPLFTFAGHMDEGFAMDWSNTCAGQLLTGDCKNNIHFWKPQDGGTWHVDQRPFVGHTASVEDLQWSPNEKSVFASCSVDHTVRIWDTRAGPTKGCMLTTVAHETDVNVLNWNKNDPFIATGGDDGIIKIWDLRQFNKGVAIAKFKHHTAPITSIEWHPTDKSVFAASGADDQLTQWDLSVEVDDEGSAESVKELPPQLLFIHQGQKDIKELHWHPQIPGVVISTALDGFNVFKTISV
uniref:Glutamate-rich WD repeat-containing protein 1 n=1 Tax=Phallusia mammillata TaxID=59560 RepID=A0A6F9DDD5_9ASCI|nr:glutamate-rich WD repeat-containing protein 1-like [Phallusia mammillata]